MKTRLIATFICTLALATTGISVLADGPQEGAQQKREQRATWEREITAVGPSVGPMIHGMEGDHFMFVSSEMSFDGKVVKDAPYSATAVTESVQTLADGNRIVNKTSASVYRDSAGRTRREQSLSRIGPYSSARDTPNTIVINDPVAEVNYILEPNSRIARKMNLMNKKIEVRVTPEEVARRIKEKEAHVAAGGHGGTIQHKIERENVASRVEVTSGMGGGVMIARSGGKPRIAPTKESLGKQMIEGVEAEGMRTTFTIPAGDIGNEMPINMVSEQWFSPELQTVVMSRHSDPRSGERIYRLTNISRTEPAASLFEVPSDYTIRDNSSADRLKVELMEKVRQKEKEQQ
jgi:hypothetical protein